MGAKKRPFYRIVVADSRTARGGRFIDMLGFYDPTTEPPTMKIDGEKAKMWIGRGAQPSDTVRSLLRKTGVVGATPEPEAPVVEEKPKPKRTTKKAAAEAEAEVAPAPETQEPAEA
jgi:small subunit ribosomal protein S16